MCPLKKSDRSYAPKVGLQGWKDGETRRFKFTDDGIDYTGEYGLTYIYGVKYDNQDGSLWVKPDGTLAIGLSEVLPETETFKGLTVDITKTLGKKQNDTRYNCKVVK